MFSVKAHQHYPTPRRLANRMIGCLMRRPTYCLDPEAGSGDLLEAVEDAYSYDHGRDSERKCDVKLRAIEIDPELCSVLAGKGFTVVGMDWLEYREPCIFDTVLMNPPFQSGRAHFLKVLNWADNTEVVCILNASTVREDQELQQRISELGGTIEYLTDEFLDAERKTAVEVAMIYCYVPEKRYERISHMEVRNQEREFASLDVENLPACLDVLGNMEHYFNLAVQHQFYSFEHADHASEYKQALRLAQTAPSKQMDGPALPATREHRAEWLEQFRKDAWVAVLQRPEFLEFLDKKQREQFIKDIERGSAYAFTAANIKATLEAIVLKRRQYFEQACANVFESLTKFFDGNDNHREGWKSNSSIKLTPRMVFPYGVSYDPMFDSFSRYRSYHNEVDICDDLDRVLCTIKRTPFAECLTVGKAIDKMMDAYQRSGESKRYGGSGRNLSHMEGESAFFRIKCHKKRTVHLWWKDETLMEDFNVLAARGRTWLGGGNPDAERPKPPAPEPQNPAAAPTAALALPAPKRRFIGWQDVGGGRQIALYE